MRQPEVEFTILPNGNLEVSISDAETRMEFADRAGQVGELSALVEFSEAYWTNSSFWPFDAGAANPFVGLTDAPCIAEGHTINDNGECEIIGRLWWFPDYMVKSFAEEIIQTGKTVFTLAQ